MTNSIDYILAIDPGDTTGWATLEFNGGKLIDMGQTDLNETLDLIAGLDTNGLMRIVCEDFLLFKQKARQQAGSRFKAVQIIGAIKSFARRENIPLILQPSGILTVAAKISGVVQPNNHAVSHKIDAFNHGFYYLVNVRKAKSKAQRELDEANGIA